MQSACLPRHITPLEPDTSIRTIQPLVSARPSPRRLRSADCSPPPSPPHWNRDAHTTVTFLLLGPSSAASSAAAAADDNDVARCTDSRFRCLNLDVYLHSTTDDEWRCDKNSAAVSCVVVDACLLCFQTKREFNRRQSASVSHTHIGSASLELMQLSILRHREPFTPN